MRGRIKVEGMLYSTKTPVPNLEPSPELSYLLGIRYGDIRLMKNENVSYCVGLCVKDEDFAETFSKSLEKIIGRQYPIYVDKRGYFIVAASNRILYDYFSMLTLEDHKVQIEKYPEDFLRGFSDSEGNVGYRRPKARVGRRVPYIRIGITDNITLRYTEWLFNQLFIETRYYEFESYKRRIGRTCVMSDGRIVTAKSMIYTLVIGKYDSLLLFSKIIGFSIKRKAEKLEVELSALL